MATAAEILQVRLNTNEPTETTYTDSVVGGFVDAQGVSGASAALWRMKAAAFSALVDISEAGASHKYGELYKNALAMSKTFESTIPAVVAPETPVGRVKVKKIERS